MRGAWDLCPHYFCKSSPQLPGVSVNTEKPRKNPKNPEKPRKTNRKTPKNPEKPPQSAIEICENRQTCLWTSHQALKLALKYSKMPTDHPGVLRGSNPDNITHAHSPMIFWKSFRPLKSVRKCSEAHNCACSCPIVTPAVSHV